MRLSVLARTRQSYQRFWKRVFDIVLALLMLPALLPVIAVLWLLVRRDGGSGFFGHRRVGQCGRTFRCYKIRTMVPDADRRLAEYLATNPEAAEEWTRDHKLTDDPRITSLGRFLRASSLDELPQIWNVLRGDMSFVGPRPVVRAEMRRYGPYRSAYLALKPGITGVWQVSGRNDVSYQERVRMDVSYLANASLKTDLYLLFKTVNAVLDRTGR
ncbi:sugar transferase [Roseivivax sediminis]|nr:sugar transferase [Roseivivax sediminis]